MQEISSFTEISNDRVGSANPAKAAALNRAVFATDLAQAAFGAVYAPPAHANFIDRSPSEISAIRATMGLGAAR